MCVFVCLFVSVCVCLGVSFVSLVFLVYPCAREGSDEIQQALLSITGQQDHQR